MGAQQNTFLLGVEGIPHVPRRVVWRHVQVREVVIVRLNLGRGEHLKAHIAENLDNAPQHLGQGMQAAACYRAPGQGHIQLFGLQCLFEGIGFQQLALLFQRTLQGLADFVGCFPHQWPQFLIQGSHTAEHPHHRRAAAQVCHAPGFQSIGIRHIRQGCQRIPLDLLKISQVCLFICHQSFLLRPACSGR